MLASCNRQPPPPAAPPSDPDAVARGAQLFATSCAPCHGERADGHGVRRRSLTSSPADLTRLSAERSDPQRLFAVLRDGVPGSDMPSWRALSERERWDLVAFVRSLSVSAEESGAGREAEPAQ
jgi:mono/diheme cytochrome c family protein